MSKESIKTSINTYIKENGNLAITGQILNSVMNEMVDGLASEEELATKQDTTSLVTDLAAKVNALSSSDKAAFLGQISAMPATPSGDPMHYAYIAAGAEYNDTGADITKTTPWADLVDDDADKVVTHKAGYWFLNGLGDITTEEMRKIYNLTINFGISPSMGEALKLASVRTNFFLYFRQGTSATDMYQAFYHTNIEVGRICSVAAQFIKLYNMRFFASLSQQTRHFVGIFNLESLTAVSNLQYAFDDCPSLMTIKMQRLKLSISFPNASMLTSKSILYMIQNEAATSAITITLHADAYARAMANADIVAALQAHPKVSLASA